MATPGALEKYHPFCSRNPVETWPGAGSRDSIHYLSGLILERRFTAWDEGGGYQLDIGKPGWPVSHVRWMLEEAGPDESELTISISPNAFEDYPKIARWVLDRWYLVPLLERYLGAVLQGLDHYLTTGREVAPNQFGRVRFFSYGGARDGA